MTMESKLEKLQALSLPVQISVLAYFKWIGLEQLYYKPIFKHEYKAKFLLLFFC